MAKDYSKLKALLQSCIECIGDEDEGENPSLPKQAQDFNKGGQASLTPLDPIDQGDTGVPKDKKKNKDDTISMMASTLSKSMRKG